MDNIHRFLQSYDMDKIAKKSRQQRTIEKQKAIKQKPVATGTVQQPSQQQLLPANAGPSMQLNQARPLALGNSSFTIKKVIPHAQAGNISSMINRNPQQPTGPVVQPSQMVSQNPVLNRVTLPSMVTPPNTGVQINTAPSTTVAPTGQHTITPVNNAMLPAMTQYSIGPNTGNLQNANLIGANTQQSAPTGKIQQNLKTESKEDKPGVISRIKAKLQGKKDLDDANWSKNKDKEKPVSDGKIEENLKSTPKKDKPGLITRTTNWFKERKSKKENSELAKLKEENKRLKSQQSGNKIEENSKSEPTSEDKEPAGWLTEDYKKQKAEQSGGVVEEKPKPDEKPKDDAKKEESSKIKEFLGKARTAPAWQIGAAGVGLAGGAYLLGRHKKKKKKSEEEYQ